LPRPPGSVAIADALAEWNLPQAEIESLIATK
jgi:hypothetical protein